MSVSFSQYFLWLVVVLLGTFALFQCVGFYIVQATNTGAFAPRKIVNIFGTDRQHWMEFRQSLISHGVFIVAGVLLWAIYRLGFSQIYESISDRGVAYYVLSYFILHVLHDTYFYWTHRALHEVSWLKRHHATHHISRAPSPLAAVSFSWAEAVVQAGFYVLVSMIVPMHWSMLILFYVFVAWISVLGHAGLEFWPNSLYRFPFGFTFNSLTAHNLHHFYGRGNYALYYRFWDEVCGTGHPENYNHFYKVQQLIGAAKGRSGTLQRPHPNDYIGVYFEECQAQGDDISIRFGFCPTDAGNWVPIDSLPRASFSHAACDPKTAMQTWLPNPVLSPADPKLGKSWVLLLTKAETGILSEIASGHGSTPARLVLYAMNTLIEGQAAGRRWLIELVDQKPLVGLENGKRPSNLSRLIDKKLIANQSVSQLEASYQRSTSPRALKITSMALKIWDYALKIPYKPVIWMSRKLVIKFGSFCELGSFSGAADQVPFVLLPVNEPAPISLGVLTYNDQLVVTLSILRDYDRLTRVLDSGAFKSHLLSFDR